MIRCLTGEVLNVVENAVLLDVHGMGFDVLSVRTPFPNPLAM